MSLLLQSMYMCMPIFAYNRVCKCVCVFLPTTIDDCLLCRHAYEGHAERDSSELLLALTYDTTVTATVSHRVPTMCLLLQSKCTARPQQLLTRHTE